MPLDSFETDGDYFRHLIQQSAVADEADKLVEDAAAKQELQQQLEPEQPSILKRKLSDLSVPEVKEATRGLLSSADEALMRIGSYQEGEDPGTLAGNVKRGVRIFLDTMNVLPKAVQMLGEGIGTEAAKISMEPAEALPAVLSIAGGVAGGTTGNPAIAYAGGLAGRTLGRYLLSRYEGNQFGTVEDAVDLAMAGIGGTNLTAPIGGALRGQLRKAGLVKGSGVGFGLVKNRVERNPLLSVPKAEELAQVPATYAEDKQLIESMKGNIPDKMIDELKKEILPGAGTTSSERPLNVTKARIGLILLDATEKAQALRDFMYGNAKKMNLVEKYQGRSMKDVLLDPEINATEKVKFIEQAKSIDEDLRMSRSLTAAKGKMTKAYGPAANPDNIRTELLPSEAEAPLKKTLAERMELINSVLENPRKPGKTLLETVPGRKRRFVEYAESEEADRIGSEAWRKNLNEYANNDLDAMKTILGVVPELIDDPLVHKLTGRFSMFPAIWNVQTGLRKNGQKLLQGIGDVILHATEGIRTTTGSLHSTLDELKEKWGDIMTPDRVMHVLHLQNNGDMLAAYDTVREQLGKMAQHEADSLNAQAATLAGQAQRTNVNINIQPRDIEPELRAEMLKAADRYGYVLHPDEMDDFMHSLRFMDDWRHEVSDTTIGVAHYLNRDPEWLKMVNPAYFLPTFTTARDLDTVTHQLAMLNTLAGSVNTDTTIGKFQAARYGEAVKAMERKQITAQRVHDKSQQSIQNIYSQLADRGVKGLKASYGSFMDAKGSKLPFDLDIWNSAHDWVDGFIRKAYMDNAMPAGHDLLQQFIKANIGDKATEAATERAASWAHTVLLDQLGLRKMAKLNNYKKQFAGKWQEALGGFENAMSFIQKAHYILNVPMKPRFYGLNFAQNILGLMHQVDTESLAHGLSEVMFNRAAVEKKAMEAGVVGNKFDPVSHMEFLKTPFTEAPAQGAVKGWLDKTMDKVGYIAEQSEKWNRMVAYEAGLKHAELNGLTGEAAHRKALDIVRDSHFMFDAANRPTITNTPFTSMMFRYRSFSQEYASTLAHTIRSGDMSRAGAALAALWSVSGTHGIPLYSLVRMGLAQQGIEVPVLAPAEEMLGIDMGGAEGALPQLITSPDEALGVFWKQINDVTDILKDEKGTWKQKAAAASLKLLGSPVNQAISAGAELAANGLVTSPNGKELKSSRTFKDTVLSGVGLQPSARALQGDTQRRMKLALTANSADFLKHEIERAQKKGVTNIDEMITRLLSKQQSGENASTMEILTGIPKL